MKIEDIAKVCHEVNRAYCEALGDNSQKPWEAAPQEHRDSSVDGVKARMDGPLSPEEAHTHWMRFKVDNGWTYGKVKDGEKRTHPNIVPYSNLSSADRAKDYICNAVVDHLVPFLE